MRKLALFLLIFLLLALMRAPATLLDAALQEMLYASNHAWAMYTGIAHGAYLCLKTHAAPWLQARYLPDIVSGQALPFCSFES